MKTILPHRLFYLAIATTLGSSAILSACSTMNNDQTVSITGVVTSTAFKPGSPTDPIILAGYYKNALVCIDANNNGKCDPAEKPVMTDSKGRFTLTAPAATAIIADIGATATNTATGAPVSARTVFRVSAGQVAEQGRAIVVSPLSAEVARMMDAGGNSYATEKQNLATRLSLPVTSVLSDVNTVVGAQRTAMLIESNALSRRFAYAIAKLDRGDLYPDALAVPGGDPRLSGHAGASASVADTRKVITFAQSQRAAFNVEDIPRYDHLFIVMLENKAASAIVGSPFAPKINAYLKAGNQLTNYYATSNPSEPNYTALGGADDFGISDDSQWNCDAAGPNAVQDLPEPTRSQPGLASSSFKSPCTQTAAVNHNIVGKQNLFNALTGAGLTWRTYSESMNPGQDVRTDSVADAAVVASDNVYPPGAAGGNADTVGDANLRLPLPAGLYKTKHHPGMAFQNVRSAPEWKYSNRTMGGGQWDAFLKNSTAYKIPSGYDYDQFSSDLANGTVGNLNFVIPDQCDDMHGIAVKGRVDGATTVGIASDCSGVANNVKASTGGMIIQRGDNYVDWVVRKIQTSALWKNPQERVAIILMFDEGSAISGFNSCCGWNPPGRTVANPLKLNADGSWAVDGSINNYTKGNHGHGQSVFGILTNQEKAPKGISDGDAYSHFSLVRTLQDMFQLADPAIDASYMNRSKYTEKFIAENIRNLPEYAHSADTHFDSVRPINHAFVAPATYAQKQSVDSAIPAQVGPDQSQVNVWAIK